MTRPRLASFLPSLNEGLGAYSWEERRRLTAGELIKVMGPLHISHPAFQPRPRSFLSLPNLAGQQPVLQHCDLSLWGQIRLLLGWAAR